MSRGSGSKSVDVPNGSEAVDHAPTARRPLWFPKLITITRPPRRPQHRAGGCDGRLSANVTCTMPAVSPSATPMRQAMVREPSAS